MVSALVAYLPEVRRGVYKAQGYRGLQTVAFSGLFRLSRHPAGLCHSRFLSVSGVRHESPCLRIPKLCRAGRACLRARADFTHAPAIRCSALPPNQSDRSLLAKSDSDRKSIEASLQNTLVAYDTGTTGPGKLGVALTSFSSIPLELAYDPDGKNLMAQWRSVYTTAAGQSFRTRPS